MFVHLDPFGDVALNEGRARTTFGLGPTVEAFQRLVRVAGRDWCGRFSGHPSDCTTCVHSRRGGRSQVEFGGARGIRTGHTVGGPFLSLLAVPTPRPLAPSSTSRNATDQRPRLTAGVRTPASNTERSVKRVDAGPSWSIAYLNRRPICESASRPNSIGRWQLLFRWFDRSAELRVRAVWKQMAESGVDETLHHGPYRPHITLGIWHDLTVDDAVALTKVVASICGPVRVQFEVVGMFVHPEAAVFLAPTVSFELRTTSRTRP